MTISLIKKAAFGMIAVFATSQISSASASGSGSLQSQDPKLQRNQKVKCTVSADSSNRGDVAKSGTLSSKANPEENSNEVSKNSATQK